MRNTNEKDRRTGRPSSGEYGTTKDITEYRKNYNSRIDPERALQYRLRQAYNFIQEHGAKYGYTATFTDLAERKSKDAISAQNTDTRPCGKQQTEEQDRDISPLDKVLKRISRT